MPTEWYWCLTHQQAEEAADRDDPDSAMGPYPTAEAARAWKVQNQAREEAWKAQDDEARGEAL